MDFKKFLMVVILFTFIISGNIFAVNYDDSLSFNSKAEEAVKFLVDIGFWDRQLAETPLENVITRSEFVSMVSKLIITDDVLPATASIFADVDDSEEYAVWVNMLYETGSISRSQSGNFYPGNDILMTEAIKILVELSGHGYKAQSSGGYPTGYLTVASSLNILGNMPQGEYLTFAKAATLIRNILNVDVAQQASFGEENRYYITAGYTLMEHKLGIYNGRGRVMQNFLTRLDGSAVVSGKHIEIDDKKFKSKINYDKYLGYNVEYYYKEDENGEYELVCVYPLSKNRSVTFMADDIESFRDMTYTVYGENRNVTYSLKRSIDVIYNKVAYPGFLENDLTPQIGEVTLLDSDGDSVYETVFITCIVDYVVSSVTDNGDVYDLLSNPPINIGDTNKNIQITAQGEPIAYSELQKNEVLSVMESKNTTGKQVVFVTVSNMSVTGTIDEIDSDGKITVGGKEYEYSKQFVEDLKKGLTYLPPLNVGNTVVIYLNAYNQVAFYEKKSGEGEFYGYIIKGSLTDGITKEAKLRIINNDNALVDLTLKDKLMVDGASGTNTGAISALSQNGNIKPQLIRYTVNAKGLIDMIDTAVTGSDENPDECLTSSTINQTNAKLTYKRSSRTFDGIFSTSNKCSIFSVPGEGFEDDETLYMAGNAGIFVDGTNYAVKPYSVDDARVAKVVVVLGSGADADIPMDAKLFLIESVSKVLVDDELTYKLSGLMDGVKYSAIVKNTDVKLYDRTDNSQKKECSEINKGDVVRIGQDSTSKITNIERLVNMKAFEQDPYTGVASRFSSVTGNNNATGGYRDTYTVRGGFVYAKSEDIIAVTNTPQQPLTAPNITENLITYSAQAPKIMVYDMVTGTSREGSIDNIIPYKITNDESKASFVYIHTTSGDPKGLIVFER